MDPAISSSTAVRNGPARAGMNPGHNWTAISYDGRPRARGDATGSNDKTEFDRPRQSRAA